MVLVIGSHHKLFCEGTTSHHRTTLEFAPSKIKLPVYVLWKKRLAAFSLRYIAEEVSEVRICTKLARH